MMSWRSGAQRGSREPRPRGAGTASSRSRCCKRMRAATWRCCAALRCDQFDGREVGAETPCVAGQQTESGDGCMGANEEVGQHTGPLPTRGTVALEYFTCEKQGC